ncbi:MAG: tetratricopeptide repeat protein [Bacteroidaceae bacterium]|nr:tetratricopeptide repeat protein [Bacteroidaceae bacterium]MBR1788593.1 tetratricopeptide repeat protein [Bacteroidaceae bacterium]
MAEKTFNKGEGRTQQEVVLEESFIQKNLKKIGIVAGVVIACLLLFMLGKWYFENQNQKAAEALFPSEQLYQQAVQSGDSVTFKKALEGDGVQAGLLQVAKQYGSTKAGNMAKLYAGLAYVQLGQFEDAKKYLEDFSSKDDELVSPAALGALGNVYAELGQQDKAVETLKKAAKNADNTVLSPIYLVQAGEILESQGKADEALKLYEEVKNNYRGSQQGQEIDKYIERVKAAK